MERMNGEIDISAHRDVAQWKSPVLIKSRSHVRIVPSLFGGIAQSGERRVCTARVAGSIPVTSIS